MKMARLSQELTSVSTSHTYKLSKKTDRRIACYVCDSDWPSQLRYYIENGSDDLKDYMKNASMDDNYCGSSWMDINPEHITEDKKCKKTEICYKLTIKKTCKIML